MREEKKTNKMRIIYAKIHVLGVAKQKQMIYKQLIKKTTKHLTPLLTMRPESGKNGCQYKESIIDGIKGCLIGYPIVYEKEWLYNRQSINN